MNSSLLLLAIGVAEAHFYLFRRSVKLPLRKSQAQLGRHAGDLLIVELGHRLGDLVGPFLLDMGLCEDQIDLLQLAAGCLRVEVPAKWHGNQIDQCEEQIDTPGTGVREDGREHDHGEIGEPVSAGRHGGGGGTGAQGVDLGRVDPGQRKDGEGEEHDEEEDPDDSTLGVLLGGVSQAGHGDDKAEALAEEADQEELTAADLLDHEEGGNRRQCIDGGEDTTQDQGETVAEFDVLFEQQG